MRLGGRKEISPLSWGGGQKRTDPKTIMKRANRKEGDKNFARQLIKRQLLSISKYGQSFICSRLFSVNTVKAKG